MRILVCGSRDWDDRTTMAHILAEFPSGTVIIEGDCRGADRMAACIGRVLGFEIESYPADWAKYRNAAGPIRNQQMIDEGKPVLVLAFHEDLEKSKGTRDMLNRAMKAGIPYVVIPVIKGGEDERATTRTGRRGTGPRL